MAQKPIPTSPAAVDSIQQIAIRIKRHQWRLYVVGLLAIISTSGLFFFNRYQHQQNNVAQREMFQAVYYFEQEDFDKAIYGDGTCAGLLDIVKEYRFTQAANLAHFYVGVGYLHQKDYVKAIRHLTRFKSRDSLLQARAWALVGDAYAEQQNYQQAISYYMKAAAYKPNKIFTPVYLVKAALAYEATQEHKKALACYQRIVKEFAEAAQYGEALKHVARLKAIHTKQQLSASQQNTP